MVAGFLGLGGLRRELVVLIELVGLLLQSVDLLRQLVALLAEQPILRLELADARIQGLLLLPEHPDDILDTRLRGRVCGSALSSAGSIAGRVRGGTGSVFGCLIGTGSRFLGGRGAHRELHGTVRARPKRATGCAHRGEKMQLPNSRVRRPSEGAHATCVMPSSRT